MDSFPQEGSFLSIFHVLIRCIKCPGGRAQSETARIQPDLLAMNVCFKNNSLK